MAAPSKAESSRPSSRRKRKWGKWLVLVLVLAAGAVAAVVVLLRRRHLGRAPDRTWAESVLARLEAHGAARTDPRRPAESVVAYLDRLARAVDGDRDRLRDVGEVLDGALYGDAAVAADARRRIEAVVDAVLDGDRSGRTGPRRPPRPDPDASDDGGGGGDDEDDRVPALSSS